jgi:hypothetical protein
MRKGSTYQQYQHNPSMRYINDSDSDDGSVIFEGHASPYPGYDKPQKQSSKETEQSRQTIKLLIERQEVLISDLTKLKMQLADEKRKNEKLNKDNVKLLYQIPPRAEFLSEAPWPKKEKVPPLETMTCSFCNSSNDPIIGEIDLPGHDFPIKTCAACVANYKAYVDLIRGE